MPSTSTLVDSIYTRRVSAGECYPPDLVKSPIKKAMPDMMDASSNQGGQGRKSGTASSLPDSTVRSENLRTASSATGCCVYL